MDFQFDYFYDFPTIPNLDFEETIDIIIPVYNSLNFLIKCLESIGTNTNFPYRLIIVDDKSTDPRVLPFLYDFKINKNTEQDIIIIENQQNLGFVKSVNKAAKLCKNHFVILNSDVEVPPNWLERLIYPIIKFDKIASVTPFTNSGTICSFPEFLQDNELFMNLDVETIDKHFQVINPDKTIVEIPTGVGFCMAINKEVYDKIGLFDEIFGKGYGEENDWCMRAKKHGYKNVIATNLFVYHKHGASFSNQEKKKLIERNLKILSKKHPEYFQLVNDFINKDPLKDIRELIKIKILSSIKKPVIIIDHKLGGGANEFSKKLKSEIELNFEFNFDTKKSELELNIYFQNKQILSLNILKYSILEKIINFFSIMKIYINELVSFPYVLELIDILIKVKQKKQNLIYQFFVHDYFFVCPNFNLTIHKDGIIIYCNVPADIEFCNNCLYSNPIYYYINPTIKLSYPNLKITEWRNKFAQLINLLDKIIVFSKSSINIIKKAYPFLDDNKIELKPHTVNWVRKVNIKKTTNTLKIGVIGNINLPKGNIVILNLCEYLKKNNLDIEIHIFGDFDNMETNIKSYKNLILHAKYQRDELPELMEKNEIDIIFIPSLWPETFSYTTEEAIQMGLPVAVFNLGAPPERVKYYEKGLILNSVQPEIIISEISSFLKNINKKSSQIEYKKRNFQKKKYKTKCIIFSKDRPMQLDACINSLLLNISEVEDINICVLYKTSNQDFEASYMTIISEYPQVEFVKEKNFKYDLLNILRNTDYIMFCVDDTIFVNPFSLNEIENLLSEESDSIGFSLRLGENTTYCYPLDKNQNLPPFEFVRQNVLKFNWTNAELDFGYPLELSSSIYRTDDIYKLLEQMDYTNPNTLEAEMDLKKNIFIKKPYLLCYSKSVSFSVPINIVQTSWKNRASTKKEYSAENLLRLFEEGYRIDISKFQGFVPNACHQEVNLDFVVRKEVMTPKVSIIIPCYNQAEYLTEAVESVVNQTYQSWECIIVNDGSPDNTREVAKNLINKYNYKQIIYLEKENGGVASARNYGINKSRGRYILPLDADDKIHHTFLEKTVNILDYNPYIHIVYTDLQEFGDRANLVQAQDWNPNSLPYQNHLNYCSLFRKEVWVKVGGYNPNMVQGYEDWDFWIGAAEYGFVGYHIKEPLFFYRVKEISREINAHKFDLELKARIILNHPKLYNPEEILWAESFFKGHNWAINIPKQIGIVPHKNLLAKFIPFDPTIKTHILAEKTVLVSVIIPTYNRPNFIKNSLNSALTQMLKDIEVIVINDGGVDIKSIIDGFNDSRVRYFSLDKHLGVSRARNIGIMNAKGKYISYLDDDDFFFPNHLAILVSFLEQNPEIDLVYSDAIRLHQIKIGNTYYTHKLDFPYSQEFDRVKILFGNFIPIDCIVHRKSIFNKIGLFDETLEALEDWDFLIRTSRLFSIKHLNVVTCAFSWREDGSSTTSAKHHIFKKDQEVLHLRYKNFILEEIESEIERGNLDTAEKIISMARNIYNFDKHLEFLNDLAIIRVLQNRNEEAIQIFSKILSIDPNNEIAKENLLVLTSL